MNRLLGQKKGRRKEKEGWAGGVLGRSERRRKCT